MNDNATKIQACISTLEQITIQASCDNMTKLLSIFQALAEIRDSLINEKKEDGESDV